MLNICLPTYFAFYIIGLKQVCQDLEAASINDRHLDFYKRSSKLSGILALKALTFDPQASL